MAFLRGVRFVLHFSWDNDQFSCVYYHWPITQVHTHSPRNDKENLVCVVVFVPDEIALEFHDFEVMVVYLCNDLGRPLVFEHLELFGDTDRFELHSILSIPFGLLGVGMNSVEIVDVIV